MNARARERVLARLRAYAKARAALHDSVVLAATLGVSQVEIARESGLSREGVRKIIARQPGLGVPVMSAAHVQTAKAMIVADVAAGVLDPRDVDSFSDLHDFVDENDYLAHVPFPDTNVVAAVLDEWIKGGALRGAD